jgi:hypothetical protein
MELEEGKYCNGTFMELCLTRTILQSTDGGKTAPAGYGCRSELYEMVVILCH